jgi:HD-GYP domain-containing protein (c-di-GMP phosphodiesterase class II)
VNAQPPVDDRPAKTRVEFVWSDRLRVRELEGQVNDLRKAMVCSFHQILDLRDLNTGVHSTRLAEWAVRVGREFGVPEEFLADLEVGALLHDIGKVGISENILGKPDGLTEEEFRIVRRHPELGWNVIRNLPGLERASLLVLHHHENFDGTGYPAGLKGNEIPIGARILSVIDAFDAMISARPYRSPLPLDEVLKRLEERSGIQFDPAIVQSLIRIARTEMPAVLDAVG